MRLSKWNYHFFTIRRLKGNGGSNTYHKKRLVSSHRKWALHRAPIHMTEEPPNRAPDSVKKKIGRSNVGVDHQWNIKLYTVKKFSHWNINFFFLKHSKDTSKHVAIMYETLSINKLKHIFFHQNIIMRYLIVKIWLQRTPWCYRILD